MLNQKKCVSEGIQKVQYNKTTHNILSKVAWIGIITVPDYTPMQLLMYICFVFVESFSGCLITTQNVLPYSFFTQAY